MFGKNNLEERVARIENMLMVRHIQQDEPHESKSALEFKNISAPSRIRGKRKVENDKTFAEVKQDAGNRYEDNRKESQQKKDFRVWLDTKCENKCALCSTCLDRLENIFNER